MTELGNMREDILVQPISGVATPVYKGEVLRIIQEEGGQCVDTNVFSLHDYREFMDTSIMRRQGFHLEKGDFLISNSPRNRLLMQILDKTPHNIIDVLVHRCSPAWIEAIWDVDNHSSCQGSLAEAIGQYGLTPDDTHAVLCPWTPTKWDDRGRFTVADNRNVLAGDTLDLLALEDVLAANVICGCVDYLMLGNYWPRPIRIQIFEPSSDTEALVDGVKEKWPPLKGHMTPKDYRQNRGRKDEDFEIHLDPDYDPQFPNFPQKVETIEVELGDEDYEQVERQVARGLRDDADDAIRTAVMEWYLGNRTKAHPLAGVMFEQT